MYNKNLSHDLFSFVEIEWYEGRKILKSNVDTSTDSSTDTKHLLIVNT